MAGFPLARSKFGILLFTYIFLLKWGISGIYLVNRAWPCIMKMSKELEKARADYIEMDLHIHYEVEARMTAEEDLKTIRHEIAFEGPGYGEFDGFSQSEHDTGG